MSTKKSPQADIEKKRSGFIQVGLIASIGLTLAAFEYTTFSEKEKSYVNVSGKIDTEPAPIPIPPKPEPEKKIKQENKEQKQSSSSTATSTDFKKVSDNTKEKQTGPITDSIPVTIKFENDTTPDIACPEPFVTIEEWPYFPKFKKIKNMTERKKKTETEMKEFVGGKVVYTEKMRELGIQGTIKVAFVVNKEGKIDPSRVKVTRGLHPDLDQQVVNAVLQMPELIPGKQRNKPVDVPYSLPITIVLK